MENINLASIRGYFADWIYENYIEKAEIKEVTFDTLVLKVADSEVESYLRSMEQLLLSVINEHFQTSINNIVFEQKKEETKIVIMRYEDNLDSSHTFENFQIGPSNDNAFTIARQLSIEPTSSPVNSLFVYGGSGLGKTHLLHALGNEIKERHKNLNTMYIATNTFIDEFFAAFNKGSEEVELVKKKYTSLDVLLFDDAQMFNKSHLKNVWAELFNILENVYKENKLVVFASDKPAKDFNYIEERIITRMNWGSVVTITSPGYDLRREILKKKIENNNYEGISGEVIDYIASNVTHNVRELEGALTTIITQSLMFSCFDVSLEDAKKWLSHLTTQDGKEVDVNKVKKVISESFAIPIEELTGTSRKKEIVLARNVAIKLCFEELGLSKNSIGSYFGGKDHTTIMHSIKTINERLTSDGELLEKVTMVKKQLKK